MIYFAVPLRAKATSQNWGEDVINLEKTLRSVAECKNYKVFIACHDIPDLSDDVAQLNIEFISVSLGVPRDKSQYMYDKGSKKKVAREAILKEAKVGDYFMYLDADDILRNDFMNIVKTTYEKNPDILDIIFFTGYVYDVNRKLVAYLNGKNKLFYRNCGSCMVSKLTESDFILGDDVFLSALKSHVKFPLISLEYSRSLYCLFEPMVCYMVNHGNNDSSIRRKENIIEKFVNAFICKDEALLNKFQKIFVV